MDYCKKNYACFLRLNEASRKEKMETDPGITKREGTEDCAGIYLGSSPEGGCADVQLTKHGGS